MRTKKFPVHVSGEVMAVITARAQAKGVAIGTAADQLIVSGALRLAASERHRRKG